jgi:hypothetical protein
MDLVLKKEKSQKKSRTIATVAETCPSTKTGGATTTMTLDAALLAPSKNMSDGRLTSSRVMTPYELTSN